MIQDDLSSLSNEELARIAGVTLQPRQQTAPQADRGTRNANAGNLKASPWTQRQPGYVGQDAQGFAMFDSPQSGEAAQLNLLRTNYAGMSPSQVVNKYAPVGPENSPESVANYIRYAAQRAGIDPNAPIPEAALPAFAQAMREFETGQTVGGGAQSAPEPDLNSLSDEELMQLAGIAPGQQQGQSAQGASQDNPIDLTGQLYQDQVDALKQGAWVRAQNGEVYQLPGDAFTANTRPADEAQGGNVFLRRPNLEDRIGAFASAAAEQIPFLDESVAATTGLLSGQGYDAMRQAQFINRDLLNQTNRGERNAGGIAGVGATLLLPGVGASGRYVASGANRFEQARRAMQVGGVGGFGFGFANTDGDVGDRTVGGLVGGGSGAVAGPIGDELVRALPAVTRRIGSGFSEAGARIGRGFGLQPRDAVVTPAATNKATDFVRRLVEQSGRDLSANPALAMGKPITAAESIGPAAVSQVAALSRRSGRAGDLAQDVLGARAADQSGRIIADLSRSSGRSAGEAQDAVSSLAAQSRQSAAPLYEQAYQAQNVASPTLSSLMQRPSMRSAMNKAVAIAREEGRNPEDLGFVVNRLRTPGGGWTEEVTEVATPSMQTWDYVKRGLDDVLEGYRDPTTRRMNLDTAGRAAEATRQALRSELTNPNTPWGPAYRAALEAGGDAPRLEGAFREGPNLFSSTVNERTFRQRVGNMGEADRGAMLSGVVDDLYNKARTGRLNIRQLRTPAAREKLSLLMGGEAADDFVNRLAAEADMARLGGRMAPGTNSITSEVQEAIREQDRGVGILSDLSRNLENSPGPISALMKTGTEAVMAPVAGFVRGVQTPAPQATRDEIARLLLGSPEELNNLLASQLARPPRATRGAYTGGLFGGKAGSGYANSRQQPVGTR